VSDYAKGLWLTLTGVLILSPDVLLIRLAGLPEWTLMFWRGAGMGGMIALWLLVTQGRAAMAAFRGVGLAGLAIGLSYTVGNVSFLYSVGHTLAANTLFILATMPVFSALIARFVLGQPVPGRTWATIAAVLVGIALIAMGVSLFLAPGLSVPAVSVPFVALIALIVTPGATALLSLGPRYLPPADVSLIMLLEAVFGPLLVWLVLAEFPGGWTLAGGAVVLGALTLNNLAGLRERR